MKSKHYNKQDIDDFSESRKWLNYQEEWNEYNKNTYKSDRKEQSDNIKGKIVVYSSLGSKDGTRIKGVKINLYLLNGISPQLVESKHTDCNGMVIFDNVPRGNYRVIELIDKRYFAKPSYLTWNEVNIDDYNNSSTIYVVNKIKNKKGYKFRN